MSTAIQSSPVCTLCSVSRQHRERKESPSENPWHNSISLQNLTGFQIILKEEISLHKEQALATW